MSVAELRQYDGHSNSIDARHCPKCYCPKSGHVAEPNDMSEACEDERCLCHVAETAIVEIPGSFNAHYVDGQITKLVFQPYASHAGYTGEVAIAEVGDLDIHDVDGPFWRAMQEALRVGKPCIVWEE